MCELLKYLSDKNLNNIRYSDYSLTDEELVQGSNIYLEKDKLEPSMLKVLEDILNENLQRKILSVELFKVRFRGTTKELFNYINNLLKVNKLNDHEKLIFLIKNLTVI
ncbi:MAG: hypothetical protein ACRCX8_07910 [Sarcina sp.]